MKVFISWSGERSKEIAQVFKEWIPAVIQAAKPYYSSSDIDKGARWNSEIAKELESSKVGLICLTRENLNEPWIMFEAGALSKSLEKSRVCPMLFDVEPSDIKGPLVQFQATQFNKEEVKKLVKTVNGELAEGKLEASVLDSVFEKWWGDLETKISKIIKRDAGESEEQIRTDRDILEEILNVVRVKLIKQRSYERLPDQFIIDVFYNYKEICQLCHRDGVSEITLKQLMKFLHILRFMTRLSSEIQSRGEIRRLYANLNDFLRDAISGSDDEEIPF